MSALLRELCPVNVLRPTFPSSVTSSSVSALVAVYNDAVSRESGALERALREVYSLDSVSLPSVIDFEGMSSYHSSVLRGRRLSVLSWIALNWKGCVLRTDVGLYGALQKSLHGVDGDALSTLTAAMFFVLLSLSGIISGFRLFGNSLVQWLWCIATLLLYNTSFVFSHSGIVVLWTAVFHLVGLLVLHGAVRPKSESRGGAVDGSASYLRAHVCVRGLFMVATIIGTVATLPSLTPLSNTGIRQPAL
ncbi:hypothetical protein BBBOND_0207260 [Babesia bigemina]|uniref:Uncharacterized protein n=1 Tax=Babesia bigemina TaxID=5866 RepID=A0A061D4R6_BABBI|nr:hypothetical protein BBBOND_0207210 [Babesia bigemina]XP_012767755.1 hypothetical protein BBBOND_0207260 [Babesia bigemina]CDR95563.1 hypothetical protein BBBOND_0207210 [Babesia bigemina]CDR95569.1 hypothetical protein BBBOND_0207260 [Babesia bigemina]|eukprot:XP_012767749.1 hypothetical protein BBBOND_0207210 [Babesia bigemina]